MSVTNITNQTNFSVEKWHCKSQQHFETFLVIKTLDFKAKTIIENINNKKQKRLIFKNNM